MRLFDRITFFLSGSDNIGSCKKKKSVDQIRKDAVSFSNAGWNDILRKEMNTIDTYDCSGQLRLVQLHIESAKDEAEMKYGTFEMMPDVLVLYQELLAENQRQINLKKEKIRKKEEQEKKQEKQLQEIREKDFNMIQRYVTLLADRGLHNIDVDYAGYKQVHITVQHEHKKYKIKYRDSTLLIRQNEGLQEQYFAATIMAFLKVFKSEHSSWQAAIMEILASHNMQAEVGALYKAEPFLPIHIYFMGGGQPVADLDIEMPPVKEEEIDYIHQYCGLDIENGKVEDTSYVESEEFDSMDGLQFERFCAGILEKNKYDNVSVTNGSGDQGVDIIAFRDGVKYGIQCKCYSSDIGNKAVQEIYAGKTFYNCHVGIVLTNRFFTPAAVELAKTSGIILWDRHKLLEMIKESDLATSDQK